ncbi:MAG: 3-keto-5-aminohexanoate cleavage protein [Acidimicrobiia bacterium]
MEHDAVVIEVGLNEAVTKSVHRRVPHTPSECAADARRCSDAGAAVVHWHAVDETGAQRLADAELYGAALDLMKGCGVLAYPSYPTDVTDAVDARLGHCLALRARHGLELGPVDVATVNLVLWDPASGALAPLEPVPGYEVIRNSLPFVADALARYRKVGLVPTVAAFDLGSTRAIAALAGAGLLAEPVLCKIFLWGSPAIGPEPSVEALDLHLRQLPGDLDVEWLVVPYGISDPARIEQLARAALDRGGGVRIGIGDNPIAFAHRDNPQAVELAARWAADSGRPVASAGHLRARLGIDVP